MRQGASRCVKVCQEVNATAGHAFRSYGLAFMLRPLSLGCWLLHKVFFWESIKKFDLEYGQRN